MSMLQGAKVILLVLVIAVGHPVINWGVSPVALTPVLAQSHSTTCVPGTTDGQPADSPILVVAANPQAYKCLEDCSRARQRCEQQDAHRPGTRENIEWSKQCQGAYNQCMNGCK
jgi:hypothetical protein